MSGELGKHLDGGGVRSDEPKSSGSYDPIPAGWRAVEIEKAEVKPTKKNNGTLLNIQASVITEDHNNRKVFVRINVSNPSVQCTEIGRRELAALADACDIPILDDEDKLLGKQLEMKLVIVKDSNDEPDNDVKGFRRLGGQSAPAPGSTAAPAQQQPAQTTAQPAPAASGKRPWE